MRDAGYEVGVTAGDAGDAALLRLRARGRVGDRGRPAAAAHHPHARATRRARCASASRAHPVLFSGDTLFPGGPGNTKFEGGDFPTIIRSIEDRLFSPIPADTHRDARPRRRHHDRRRAPAPPGVGRPGLVAGTFRPDGAARSDQVPAVHLAAVAPGADRGRAPPHPRRGRLRARPRIAAPMAVHRPAGRGQGRLRSGAGGGHRGRVPGPWPGARTGQGAEGPHEDGPGPPRRGGRLRVPAQREDSPLRAARSRRGRRGRTPAWPPPTSGTARCGGPDRTPTTRT